MKYLASLLMCAWVIFTCTSCIFDNSNNPPEDQGHYLTGTIKDSDGNVITDASVYIVFDFGYSKAVRDTTLPVELSSFTATITEQGYVLLSWDTQSETGLSGYYLRRSNDVVFTNAAQLQSFFPATNTSEEQHYSYTDTEVSEGTYYYWLEVININGDYVFHGPISVIVPGGPIPPEIPTEWVLQNAYPNPFNPCTTIGFSVPVASHINIEIRSDYLGAVKTLCNENKTPGIYRMQWDGKDKNGNHACNGLYQAELVATSETDSIRYHKTINLLINDIALNSTPTVYSTATGYRIPLQDYFRFGQEIIQTDENGNELGVFSMHGDFEIVVMKAGYETISRHVSLVSYYADHIEDFVLQAGKKLH